MADDKPEAKEEKPSLMMQIAGPEEVRVGSAGSVVAIVVLGVVTAVLTILLALAKRRARQELNKSRLLEEKLAAERDRVRLEDNDKLRKEAIKTIQALETSVQDSRKRIENLDGQHQDYVKKLRKVTSWDELFEE